MLTKTSLLCVLTGSNDFCNSGVKELNALPQRLGSDAMMQASVSQDGF